MSQQNIIMVRCYFRQQVVVDRISIPFTTPLCCMLTEKRRCVCNIQIHSIGISHFKTVALFTSAREWKQIKKPTALKSKSVWHPSISDRIYFIAIHCRAIGFIAMKYFSEMDYINILLEFHVKIAAMCRLEMLSHGKKTKCSKSVNVPFFFRGY